jgi:hypothetical protein
MANAAVIDVREIAEKKIATFKAAMKFRQDRQDRLEREARETQQPAAQPEDGNNK